MVKYLTFDTLKMFFIRSVSLRVLLCLLSTLPVQADESVNRITLKHGHADGKISEPLDNKKLYL